MTKMTTFGFVLIGTMAIWIGSCGANYVRGDEVAGLDDLAMSTGLDKRDLEKLFDANMASLLESAIATKWKAAPEPPSVAIFPIANETSEHVRDSLDALGSKMETQLINSGLVTMVDQNKQDALIAEISKQQGGDFDETKSGDVGRQIGARFFLTGKIHSSSESVKGEKRVQYMLFMKVVEIETGAIRWQNEANITKGLIR